MQSCNSTKIRTKTHKMSLYDGVGGPSGAKKNWDDVGFKMLQSQIAKKKAQATTVMKDRDLTARRPTSTSTPSIDMSAIDRAKRLAEESKPKPFLLKPRKALVVGHMPLSFLPSAAREESTIIFGDYTIEDEYDPLLPNEYVACVENETKLRREKEVRRHEIEDRRRRLTDPEDDDRRDAEREAKRRTMGAAFAPPQQLVEQDKVRLAEPEPAAFLPKFGSGSKGLTAAARMMEKMGYKAGSGLGAKGQGMTTALRVESRGGTNKIIHEDHDEKAFAPAVRSTDAQTASSSTTDIVRNPSKVVLLTNMIGRGEVDAELVPEVREEMASFGAVVDVVVHEMGEVASEAEAVRVFIVFASQDIAMKAVVALNGRFFGGRTVRAVFYDQQLLDDKRFTE